MSCAKSEGGTRLILLNVSNKTHSDRRINVNGFAAFCSLVANPVAGCTHTHPDTHTHAIYLAAISVSCSSGWGTVIMHVARTDTKDLLATGTGMPHTVPPLNYETVGLDARVDLFDLLYTLRLT